jgi:hypothetical protein
VFDQTLVLEPRQPSEDGVDPPAGVGGDHQAGDQPGHPVGVAGGLGMVDGQLRQPVGLTPGRCPGVQAMDQLGLAPLQLGLEQLPEQMVVAVPLPVPVQRHQQQV